MGSNGFASMEMGSNQNPSEMSLDGFFFEVGSIEGHFCQ